MKVLPWKSQKFISWGLIKVIKGLPLETKNTPNNENQRLGLIESLYMQHCSLRGVKLALREANPRPQLPWWEKHIFVRSV